MDHETQLRRAAERYAQDNDRIASQLATAAERRDRVIRAAAADGLTLRKIAQLVGISHQRVDQIVRSAEGSPVPPARPPLK